MTLEQFIAESYGETGEIEAGTILEFNYIPFEVIGFSTGNYDSIRSAFKRTNKEGKYLIRKPRGKKLFIVCRFNTGQFSPVCPL